MSNGVFLDLIQRGLACFLGERTTVTVYDCGRVRTTNKEHMPSRLVVDDGVRVFSCVCA